jgi:hypothetical protein
MLNHLYSYLFQEDNDYSYLLNDTTWKKQFTEKFELNQAEQACVDGLVSSFYANPTNHEIIKSAADPENKVFIDNHMQRASLLKELVLAYIVRIHLITCARGVLEKISLRDIYINRVIPKLCPTNFTSEQNEAIYLYRFFHAGRALNQILQAASASIPKQSFINICGYLQGIHPNGAVYKMGGQPTIRTKRRMDLYVIITEKPPRERSPKGVRKPRKRSGNPPGRPPKGTSRPKKGQQKVSEGENATTFSFGMASLINHDSDYTSGEDDSYVKSGSSSSDVSCNAYPNNGLSELCAIEEEVVVSKVLGKRQYAALEVEEEDSSVDKKQFVVTSQENPTDDPNIIIDDDLLDTLLTDFALFDEV